MKPDEKMFFDRCMAEITVHEPYVRRDRKPRDIINEPDFPIHPKRAWFLLDKWAGQGLYDYGVTVDLGWMTGKLPTSS